MKRRVIGSILLILSVTRLPKTRSLIFEKSQKAIQDEIRSVIKQITATVKFLPLLEVSCSLDLLIYPKIWLYLKSGRSQDHSSLTRVSKVVCIPSLLQSTK